MKAARRFIRLSPVLVLIVMGAYVYGYQQGFTVVSSQEMAAVIAESDDAFVALYPMRDLLAPKPPTGATYYVYNPRTENPTQYLLAVHDLEESKAEVNQGELAENPVDFFDSIGYYDGDAHILALYGILALFLGLYWVIALYLLFAHTFHQPSQRWFWLLGLVLLGPILAPMFPFAARHQVIPRGTEAV